MRQGLLRGTDDLGATAGHLRSTEEAFAGVGPDSFGGLPTRGMTCGLDP
jgi:hypothetical protein